MKRISEFHTADPVKLERELGDFEANAEQAIAEAFADAVPQLLCPAFTPNASGKIVALQVDHQLSVDTTQASAIVVLPALLSANFGRRFVLIKRFGANQISITCEDPQAKHNSLAFPLIMIGAGVRTFYCDSRGYYS